MIDINKKYRYRNGEEARILCVDRPVNICTVISMADSGAIIHHDSDGRSGHGLDEYDLIEVKEKSVFWANVYNEGRVIYPHIDKHEADKQGGASRIARIRVEYEEGQFDE